MTRQLVGPRIEFLKRTSKWNFLNTKEAREQSRALLERQHAAKADLTRRGIEPIALHKRKDNSAEG